MPNKRLAAVGIAKQTAKGTPAAQPTFWLPVTEGKPGNWELSEAPVEVASDKPLWAEVDRTAVVPGLEYTGLVHAPSIGLQLLAALGSITTTPGTPNSHVIVPAFDVPYMTLFGRAFGGDYLKIADCKADETEIVGDNAGSLRVKQTYMGVTLTWGTVAFTPTNDLTVGGTPRFQSAGGSFKFDALASPATVEAAVSKWSVKIARGAEAIPQAASVTPRDVAIGVGDITASFTLMPPDLSDMRKALTGSGSGTGISNVPVFGAFDFFVQVDANNDLRLVSPRFRAAIPMPDVDPSGGPSELAVEGSVLQPASGDGFTATLHNATASY